MKYMLSTGKVTSNKITYISDCIKLEMSLLKRDIPYFNGGIDIVDNTIITSNVRATINSLISEMISRVQKYVPGVELDITSISYNDEVINVEIKINGIPSYYELKRTD